MYQSYVEFYNDLKIICEQKITDDCCWLSFFSNAADFKKALAKARLYEQMNDISDEKKLANMGQFLIERYCENRELYSCLRIVLNKLFSIKRSEWNTYHNNLNEYSDIFISTQVSMNGAMVFTATDIASVMRLRDPIEQRYYDHDKINKFECK